MAVLNRDDYFTRLHEQIGDDTSDSCISFIEDMTDTYNDLENRANGDGEDWKRKYTELDESWKKRYRHRFFNGGDRNVPQTEATNEPDDEITGETITVEDLFKEEK